MISAAEIFCAENDVSKIFQKKSSLEFYSDSNFNSGIKGKSPVLNGNFYLNYEDLKNQKSEKLKTAFGCSLFTKSLIKEFPCSINFGNLTFGGSLSKINNPLISSFSSPFSFSAMTASGVSSSLPSYTSYTKPFSVFLEAGFLESSNKNSIVKKVNINYWAKENLESQGFSFLCGFSIPSQNSSVQILCETTAGVFSYEQKNSAKWFIDEPYFKSGKRLCMNFQVSAKYQNLYFCFLQNVYQNQFNDFLNVFRLDSKITGKHFSFIFDAVYSPADKVETPSQKKITRQSQAAASLQYKTLLKGNLFKAGLGAESFFYFQNQKTFPFSTNETLPFTQWKFSIGESFSNHFFASSVNASASCKSPLPPFFKFSDNIETAQQDFSLDSFSIQLKNSFYFTKFSPSLTFKISAVPKEDFSYFSNTYKSSIYLASLTNPKFAVSASYSLATKKRKITSQKISGSVTASFAIKQITIKGKISFESQIVE